MPRGAKPGERRGGRAKGTKNKAILERDRIAAEIAARTVADARVAGKKLAKDVLEDFMLLFAGMAAHHQPAPPTGAPNAYANEEKFNEYAQLAVSCAHKLAPYQSPTFQAIMIAPPPPDPNDPRQRKRFTLTIFEGGKPAIEVTPPRALLGNGRTS